MWLFAFSRKVHYVIFIDFILLVGLTFFSGFFAWQNFLYNLFFFFIEMVIPLVIQDLCFFFYFGFKVFERSMYISSSSFIFRIIWLKEKLTSFKSVLRLLCHLAYLRSFARRPSLNFMKHLLRIILFGLFSKTLGVIKNCTRWSEMFVIRLPEVTTSLISLKKMPINIFDLGIMQAGRVI